MQSTPKSVPRDFRSLPMIFKLDCMPTGLKTPGRVKMARPLAIGLASLARIHILEEFDEPGEPRLLVVVERQVAAVGAVEIAAVR